MCSSKPTVVTINVRTPNYVSFRYSPNHAASIPRNSPHPTTWCRKHVSCFVFFNKKTRVLLVWEVEYHLLQITAPIEPYDVEGS